MKTPPSNWIGIEAKKGGMPLLMRLRRFDVRPTEYLELFVVTWHYDGDPVAQMPDKAFYTRVEHFESSCIDRLEHENFALLVGTETGSGSIRFYFYTRNSSQLAPAIDSAFSPEDKVEFASDADADWSEYERLAKIGGLR